MALHLNDFFKFHIPDFAKTPKIAVGVSGGADSIALAHMIAEYISDIKGGEVHCLTVDHQLRPESKDEAQHVKKQILKWGSRIFHETLSWNSQDVVTSIQERARNARFDLMSQYCEKKEIRYLGLGQHADDQAETFFIRLSAGSGPDGLACMRPVTRRGNIDIVRPFLNLSHEDCVDYCHVNNLQWIEDPSNKNEKFERVRFRKSMPVLESEGFTKERLLKTIERLQDVSEITEYATKTAFDSCLYSKNTIQIVFKLDDILSIPEGLAHRLVRKAMSELNSDAEYGARMLKSEDLVSALFEEKSGFSKRTLGGCIFSISSDGKHLCIHKEKTL